MTSWHPTPTGWQRDPPPPRRRRKRQRKAPPPWLVTAGHTAWFVAVVLGVLVVFGR